GGSSRTGFNPKPNFELVRGSARSERTSSYRLSSQPSLPSGKASRLTGSSSWRRLYSAEGSNGHPRDVGNRKAGVWPSSARCWSVRGRLDDVGCESVDTPLLMSAITSPLQASRHGFVGPPVLTSLNVPSCRPACPRLVLRFW